MTNNLTIAVPSSLQISQNLTKLAADLLDNGRLVIDNQTNNSLVIHQMIDAQGLACPMPLLKTKMALKNTPQGQAVYLIASDKNSQHDITAFAKHANRQLWQAQTTDNAQNLYHFILW